MTDHFQQLSNSSLKLRVHNELGQGLKASYLGKTIQIGKPSSFDNKHIFWSDLKNKYEQSGATVVFMAIDQDIVGAIAIQDLPQKTAQEAIDYFKKQKVQTIMITGDADAPAQAIGQHLGLDQVYSGVVPDDKAAIVAQLQEEHGMCAMLGDGVNDAPALVAADTGVAMGNGTDVAIEAADVVLMKNDLNKLVQAHRVSKRLKTIIVQNICIAMLVVLLLISLTFLSRISVVTSVALHEGSTLLVLLNSLRLLISR